MISHRCGPDGDVLLVAQPKADEVKHRGQLRIAKSASAIAVSCAAEYNGRLLLSDAPLDARFFDQARICAAAIWNWDGIA